MKKFFQNESGQGMVEYGLIIALIAVVVLAILPSVGKRVKNVFTEIDTKMNDAGVANT